MVGESIDRRVDIVDAAKADLKVIERSGSLKGRNTRAHLAAFIRQLETGQEGGFSFTKTCIQGRIAVIYELRLGTYRAYFESSEQVWKLVRVELKRGKPQQDRTLRSIADSQESRW